MNRRTFLKRISASGVAIALAPRVAMAAENLLNKSKVNHDTAAKPNILCITADDLTFNALGVMGCPLTDISPNTDRLAKEGVLFTYCYNSSTICGPARATWMTGLYPQSNGYFGHIRLDQRPEELWNKKEEPDSFIIPLHRAGYLTGRINKGGQGRAIWDFAVNEFQTAMGRDPNKYYLQCKQFFERAKTEKKPFFMEANIDDPHGYWAGSAEEKADAQMRRTKLGQKFDDWPPSKKDYKPEEIPVPPWLPDLPGIRKYICNNFDSVNRMDESVGAILKALKESGLDENTLVVFLSDSGLEVPFAKASLYPAGPRTALILRWPGKIKPGQVDKDHLVETVDLAPTFLEAAGLARPESLQGHSLVPLITTGEVKSWREYAFSCFNFHNFPDYVPMRGVQNQDFVYIWNAWVARGIDLPDTMIKHDTTMQVMNKSSDPRAKARADYWIHRPVEEFFDLRNDFGCWNNLIAEKKYQPQINAMRKELLEIMDRTKDWEADSFKKTFMKGQTG